MCYLCRSTGSELSKLILQGEPQVNMSETILNLIALIISALILPVIVCTCMFFLIRKINNIQKIINQILNETRK